MKKLIYLIPLFTSLCFGAEPQFHLRELETPKDTQAINENFRNAAGEILVNETNIDGNSSSITINAGDIDDLDILVSNLRGYLSGFILENHTDTAHDILINVGMARSDDNDTTINLTSSIIKQIDATWAAGTNQGGRASGVSLTVDTWYHLFIIYNPTTEATDVVFDTSIINANAPSGYTEYRRIGSVLTDGSSNIVQFKQYGDTFLIDPIADSTSITNSLALVTISTPLGIVTEAIVSYINLTTSATDIYYASGETTWEWIQSVSELGAADKGSVRVFTNTSSQIKHKYGLNAPVSYSVSTRGWVDKRGKQ